MQRTSQSHGIHEIFLTLHLCDKIINCLLHSFTEWCNAFADDANHLPHMITVKKNNCMFYPLLTCSHCMIPIVNAIYLCYFWPSPWYIFINYLVWYQPQHGYIYTRFILFCKSVFGSDTCIPWTKLVSPTCLIRGSTVESSYFTSHCLIHPILHTVNFPKLIAIIGSIL